MYYIYYIIMLLVTDINAKRIGLLRGKSLEARNIATVYKTSKFGVSA